MSCRAGLGFVGVFSFMVAMSCTADLEQTFGSNGVAVVENLLASPQASRWGAGGKCIQVQADGNILVSSRYNAGSTGGDLFLTRWTADGELDSTFGAAGVAVYNVSGTFDEGINDILIQPDQNILAIGNHWAGSNNEWVLARLTTNGTLDASFFGGGISIFSPSAKQYEEARCSALFPDGRILVGGHAGVGNGDYYYTLGLFNTNGTLDTSFGNSGVVNGSAFSPSGFVKDIYVANDETIYAVGASADATIASYTSNGTLRADFGVNGTISTNFGGDNALYLDISSSADGSFLLTGGRQIGGVDQALLAKMTKTGSFDTNFGNGRGFIVVTNASSATDDSHAIASVELPNGDIAVAARAWNGVNYDATVTIVSADGSKLRQSGTTIVDAAADLTPRGLALGPNSSLFVAGETSTGLFLAKHVFDLTPLDTDRDGIPDEWTQSHFGHPTGEEGDLSRAGDDPDGDGYTNLEEFQNGGDPLKFDIGSAYIWTAVEVGWKSVAGTNYQVQYTTDLVSGTWKDQRPPSIGNGNTMTFLDSIRHEDGRYYRVVVATNTLYDGLVAYYPFNHGACDETGNGNHGIVSGATPATDRFGKSSAAYAFDGNDHIDTGLSMQLNNRAVSVSLWVWAPLSSPNNRIFFGHSGPTGLTTDNYEIWGPGGSSNIQFRTMGGSGSLATASGVAREEWVHVVAVAKDAPNFVHKLYVNGIAFDGGYEDCLSTLVPFFIGASNAGGTPSNYYTGSIDDVRIYDRVLTSDEVLELRDLSY
jgi:uncharacterized delta-60 repeat protein